MFNNLAHLIARRPPSEDGRQFVDEVSVGEHLPLRNRRVEWLLLACWLAIVAKCWLVVWLVDKYNMTFNPLWVIAPTVVFAAICTAVYYFWRD